jgi:putative lipoic acid-binding regulatory protein
MINLNEHSLELNYPCNWTYKLVVLESINIKKTVTEVIDQREHNIKPSKVSSKGKYKSYTLELIVHNEDDRKGLYELLGQHVDIKMIV